MWFSSSYASIPEKEISGLKFRVDLDVLILSSFLGRSKRKLRISGLMQSEAWGWFGGGEGFYKNRWNKIVDTHLRGMFFVYVMYVLREREREREHFRPWESNCFQICALQMFFIVKNVSRLCLMSLWASCYYNPCLHLWCVRLFWNVNTWSITGKILGKYL